MENFKRRFSHDDAAERYAASISAYLIGHPSHLIAQTTARLAFKAGIQYALLERGEDGLSEPLRTYLWTHRYANDPRIRYIGKEEKIPGVCHVFLQGDRVVFHNVFVSK